MSTIRAAILTVSDTASQDATADKSGPTIHTILTEQGIQSETPVIVPDDELKIRERVKAWCDAGSVDLVITTGGTGFGVRDRTPEAISPLIERAAPGLVHLLISSSLKHTPYAALARPVAGTVRNTLVVTLPGSVKAVKENLEALIGGGILYHALDLIKGGSGKLVHAALAAAPSLAATDGGSSGRHSHGSSHGHHHHHHHHHEHGHSKPRARAVAQDPSADVSARQRVSPYPLVSVLEGLQLIFQEIDVLTPAVLPVNPELRGCVLAEDVHASADVPATPTSNVDGYALRSSYGPDIYDVITGHCSSLPPTNVIYRVNTGGPIPDGADAVIMVEDTRVHSTTDDGKEEKQIETLAKVDKGENVRKAGSDAKKGDLVLEKGTILKSVGGEIGTLAFVGRTEVKVYPKPVVALLSTGNELRDLHDAQSSGTIWDTNRPSLQATLEGMGYAVIDLGIVPDDLEAHVTVLSKGLSTCDILITTGGTSMGTSDLLKPAIELELDGTIHFGRLNVKPGKPTTFATIPTPGGRNSRTPIFALPGNPASALVMFHVFVVPALRRLNGYPLGKCQLPRVPVKLQDPMYLDPRPEYHRVTVKVDEGELKAYSTGGQRSSRVASLAGANALVALPQYKEGGPKKMNAGDIAEAVIIGELEM
ncbi:MoaB/Mog domain-containing protein [Cristinia sonorae]|uniref:MoaB/Mog domain-containing protein n=1 Tax=Cristinia sonorae TaxID=1940300 RepID=A0A8K0ULJ5_9AGAR|nr:MoaB/Mog domain-containing protein [Cristinia sonorae]